MTETPTPTGTDTPTATPTPVVTCASTPLPVCRVSDKSVILARQQGGDPTKSKLQWRWMLRQGSNPADFGDPTSDTGYAFCLYDYTTTIPNLAMKAYVRPAGTCGIRGKPCWKQLGRSTVRGFRYRDAVRTQDGVGKISLKAKQGKNRTRILLVGRGANLTFPAAVSPTRFLADDPFVKVQLLGSNGQCWQADFSAEAIKNRVKTAVGLFKDKCGTTSSGPCG